MFHGFQGEYRWLESVSHGIDDVLRVCPQVAAVKSLAVTAFDQEKLKAVGDENLENFQVSGSALLIPPVEEVTQLPRGVFHEWYTFISTVPQRTFHSFIRNDWFTLGPASANRFQARSPWDFKRMQRLFWQEMESARPESYLAAGKRLIFATSDASYFSAVLRGLSPASVKTGSS